MYAGHRGAILWRKPNFTGFMGQRSDYDTYPAMGFLGPWVLFTPLHTFGWGEKAYSARAIQLRPDRGFRLQAYLQDWSVPFLFVAGTACPMMALAAYVRSMQSESGSGWLMFGSVVSLLIAFASQVVWIWSRKDERREQDIRLLLGMHAWGSSDPAYWHTSLLPQVKPATALGANRYADLARGWLAAGQWCWAMWAARLCAAVESLEIGEAITDQILAADAVQAHLRHVRKNPPTRDSAFGPTPPLATWVKGDIQAPVFTVRAE